MSPNPTVCSSAARELVASLLRDGRDVRLRLSGWSMKPLLRPGDVVEFSPGKSPVVGDVVLSRYPSGTLVAHRVIAMDPQRIWTKGDACREPDAPLPRASILACAVRVHGTLPIPLRSRAARLLGLLLNRFYPAVVSGFRTLWPRDRQQERASC